jgi:DNA-binding response OmpR family regulator
MHVLIVEDDPHTRAGLAQLLAEEGYAVSQAADGPAALAQCDRQRPDFVCLDIMLPGLSGYEVCRRLRQAHASVPILIISAKGEEVDKVLGLELGADDYLVKPFGRREVVARIRAVARRCLAAAERAPAPFAMGDLTIHPAQLRATRGDQVIDLSLRDLRILELLHRHRGDVVDRRTLFTTCWGLEYVPTSRSLDQHISQLRRRIERDPHAPAIIATVHGAGYRYDG